MQNDEQQVGHPYNVIGELHIEWRRKRKGVEETGFTWATGFPIGDGTFVATAAHLVWDGDYIETRVAYQTGNRTIQAEWVSPNPRYCDFGGAPAVFDVAVVKLKEPVQEVLTFKSVSGPLQNKDCVAAGYVKRKLKVSPVRVPAWPINGETLGGPLKYSLGSTVPGMSGGPVFDAADGNVIGIVAGDNNVDCLAAPLVSEPDGAYHFITGVMRTNRPARIF